VGDRSSSPATTKDVNYQFTGIGSYVDNPLKERFGLGGVKYFFAWKQRHQVPLSIVIRANIRRSPDRERHETSDLVGEKFEAGRAISTLREPDTPIRK
jgi:hypothetical protein